MSVTTEKEGERSPSFAQQFFPEYCIVSADEAMAHARHTESIGIPFVQRCEPNGKKLAICGAGPSLAGNLDKLKAWDGDIWAINGACVYLAQHGINATLFSVDPLPVVATCLGESAILSACCHPSVFEGMNGKPVVAFYPYGFQPEGYEGLVISGAGTSAIFTPALSVWLGYRDVTWFGCEGSFDDPDKGGTTHVNEHEAEADVVALRCGGKVYWAKPVNINQCERLSTLLHEAPHIFKEECGGLLRAFVEYGPVYDVIGASENLFARLWPDAA